MYAGQAYGDMYNKVSVLLDQHLNNEVARQLMEEYPVDVVLLDARRGVRVLRRLDEHVVDRTVPALAERRAAHADDRDLVLDAR